MDKQTVLIAEDDNALSKALKATLRASGFDVLIAKDGGEALTILDRSAVNLVVTDVEMTPMDGIELMTNVAQRYPGLPVVMMTAFATVTKAVEAMQAGARSYMVKPFLADDLLEVIQDCLTEHPSTSPGPTETGAIVCGDVNTMTLLGMAARVADSDATVLLAGESGTGKEVFARYLHQNSPRASKPFVAINCAAIPESMLEATLFGYEKGAYTGADNACSGKFEQANGGTILLDEISEMNIALQAKLLRVLQEREVERLGGKRSIELDIRILATTNRNLAVEVESGKFREDLYYRLNVFPMYIPPLRERRGDVLPLVKHFLDRYCRGQRATPTLSPVAEKRLMQYDWPGNVRELENVVQRTLILLNGSQISDSDLVFETQATGSANSEQAPTSGDLTHDLRLVEHKLILKALDQDAGNREAAARTLGISPRTLRYKIARLRDAGLTIPDQMTLRPIAASVA
ncbi:MAG: sigma-54-dependent transcriptional regulator [Woeseiaceae bacterium]